MIDVIATDYPDLFRQIDGTTPEPKGLTISTPPDTQIERVELSTWKRLLDLLIDPNIIALMLSIGLIGIVVELWNPGLVFPGTVGAISLIVGLYGLQVLPISAAGLLLMLLAAGFFIAEAFIVSHGALAVAGADHVRDRGADALRSGRATRTRSRCRSRSRSPARSRCSSASR